MGFFDALASLGGAAIGARQADKDRRMEQERIDRLAQVRFNPFNVTGPGGMGVGFSGGRANFNLGDFQNLFDQFRGGSEQDLAGGRGLQGMSNAGLPGMLAGIGQAGGLSSGAFGRAQGLQQNGFQRGLQNQMFGGASDAFGRLNQGYGDVRQGQLDLLRQEAQPFEARSFQGLLDSQQARGIGGSSGGALQTEAFARGLGQADLSRQLAASGEARNAQGMDLQNLQAFMGGGTGLAGMEDSLLSNVFNRFGATQGLASDLSNNIFNRGSSLFNQAGAGLGGAQSMIAQMLGLGQFGGNLGASQASTDIAAAGGALQGQQNTGMTGQDVMGGFLSSLGTNLMGGSLGGGSSFNLGGGGFGGGVGFTSPNTFGGAGAVMGTGSNPFAGMFPGGPGG